MLILCDEEKSRKLRAEPAIGFEDVVEEIAGGRVAEILEHRTRGNRKIFVLLCAAAWFSPFRSSSAMKRSSSRPSIGAENFRGAMVRKKIRNRPDDFEQKVEASLGEYVPASAEEKRRILRIAAKTKTISLRINAAVLEALTRDYS